MRKNIKKTADVAFTDVERSASTGQVKFLQFAKRAPRISLARLSKSNTGLLQEWINQRTQILARQGQDDTVAKIENRNDPDLLGIEHIRHGMNLW